MDKKVALITGASSGIGRAAAELFAGAGYTVCGAARRVESMEYLSALGGKAYYLDLCEEKSTSALIESIIGEYGRVDVLVNNAGYGMFGALEQVGEGEAHRQIEVNLMGLARMSRGVIPFMRKAGGGRIINISSIAGRLYIPLGDWYNASKYAVEALSDCMRVELRPLGIDVVIIEPGAIDSDWYEVMTKNLMSQGRDEAYTGMAENFAALVKRGRGLMTKPEKVAKTIFKAASKKHPRPRYRVGFASSIAPFFKTVLPTRVYDRAVCAFIKSGRKFAIKQK